MSSIFGEFFLPSDLVTESKNLLEKWFPPYLEEIETRAGLKPGTLEIPTNYRQRNTFTNQPGEKLPKCVVLTPGMIGPPRKDGSGVYRGTWRLGVGIAVSASDEDEAFLLATLYGVAVRLIFIHHPSINNTAINTVLIDESNDDLPVGNEIYNFRSASVWFAVEVNNLVTHAAGPKDPANVYGVAEKVIIQSDVL